MKHHAAVLLLAIACASPALHAQQADAVHDAVDAANRWLALADAGDGAATWEQAAPAFRAALPKPAWSEALAYARQPFGAFQSRKLLSSTFTPTLPGAPDGQYVIIRYQTTFAGKAHAVETVVPMHDKDGVWRVSGYFVK